MLNFVEEAWATVPENNAVQYFRSCDISNAIDGSEECGLLDGVADNGVVAPEDRAGLQVECCELFGGTGTEESFDDFESDT